MLGVLSGALINRGGRAPPSSITSPRRSNRNAGVLNRRRTRDLCQCSHEVGRGAGCREIPTSCRAANPIIMTVTPLSSICSIASSDGPEAAKLAAVSGDVHP